MFATGRRIQLSTRLPVRQVHGTAIANYPRGRRGRGPRSEDDPDYNVDAMPEFNNDDASAAAHLMIHQQKQTLNYLRLLERDEPELIALRKPFVPPSNATPLVVRSISYNGEEHPATKKRVILFAISQLPLKSPEAIHKLKLLAGPRWSARPHRDSGIGSEEDERIGEHGYVKISCEEFPEPAMNLKWASDVVDTLLKEANDTKDTFADVPQDQRHLAARARKHPNGVHVRGRPGHRPTIKDFPKHWLPPRTDQPSVPTTTK